MKKGKQTNGKRAAANDKPENGEAKKVAPKVEATKAEKPEERYTIGNIATVRGGFYKELCDFVAKKGNSHGVDAEAIRKEFVGRQINGRGINAQRVARYIRYAVNHGQFKVVK
jgi:hypothetical protein